ncbi:MAG: Gfo/Idh/MocA family protein [Acutalibacteraceae bacterium]
MANWGILGCGGIARHMASALRDVKDARLLACAARSQERADKLAGEFGIERAYGDWASLCADPDVEIVYVAVVNTAHAAAVRMCIEAGKAVICEKPFAMSEREGRELFALAKEKGVLLMEAIWTLFLPAIREARRQIETGAIGTLKNAAIDFSFSAACTLESRLYDPARGGGALLDVGVYTTHVAQYFFGPETPAVQAVGRVAKTGVDGFAAVTLEYPGGKFALTTCGVDVAGAGDARLYGDGGWIEIPHMFSADHLIIHRGGQPDEHLDFSGRDGFCYEAEEFQRLYENGETVSDIATPETTLRVASILDEAMRQVLGR